MHLVLGVDEDSLAQDVELPGAPRTGRRVEPLVFQLGRETRRPAVVAASGWAIDDLDAHLRKRKRSEHHRERWRKTGLSIVL